LGHTIRQDEKAVERTVLDWNPQGKSKRGRTWTQVAGTASYKHFLPTQETIENDDDDDYNSDFH
jgi:hypothetical protein